MDAQAGDNNYEKYTITVTVHNPNMNFSLYLKLLFTSLLIFVRVLMNSFYKVV